MKLPVVALVAGLLFVGLAGCQNSAQPSSAGSSSSAPAAAPNAATPNIAPSQPSPSTSAASPQAEAQIRAAIHDHLLHASNLNLQAFDTDVKQVTVQGDHAEAQVDFHIKGGSGVMQLVYQLQNRAGAWTVVDSNPAGGDFSHPGANQNQPPGTAPALGGNPHSLADTLRSFKQDGGGAPTELPPGHPAAQQ